MFRKEFFVLISVALIYVSPLYGQQQATAEDGKKVILFPDGTWKYAEVEKPPKLVIDEDPLEGIDPEQKFLVPIGLKGATVYEEPKKNSNSLAVVGKNEYVLLDRLVSKALGVSGDWWQVKLPDGKLGYVRLTEFRLASADLVRKNLFERKVIYLNALEGNLRTGPSSESEVILKLGPDDVIYHQGEEQDGWVRIKIPAEVPYEYVDGWVNASIVRETKASGDARRSGSRGRGHAYENEHWQVDCRDDEMDDFRVCWVKPVELKKTSFGSNCSLAGSCFNLQVSSNSSVDFISIGKDLYPGTETEIRIDNNPKFSLPPKRQSAAKTRPVVAQLKAGREALIQWTKWPYENDRYQARFSLIGFTAAYNAAKKAVAAYTKPK